MQSFKEQRIRKITQLYYSRQDVQEAIFKFSKNREVIPRYFEGFGKRPDSFQYQGDIFELAKRGATSFHSSEEIWEDPLKIQTGMDENQLNELRIGWDFLIDIDSKYIDYSKIMAKLIIELLNFHGIKNIGIKFSGSKGFHIIIPWKAFPKEINEVQTKNMFPEWPRIITKYIMEKIKENLIEKITDINRPNKYVKDFQAPKEVMPDLILVSPRHLFRMPYSLHEKTALASVVLDANKIEEFELKDADPMKVEAKNFIPESKEGEAEELIREALDWAKENQLNTNNSEEKIKGKYADFKAIELKNLTDQNFPPCVLNILRGLSDGKKRALFILINLFRSVGMDKEEMEKRIEEWNNKNKPPMKKGYVKSQLSWSYRKKPIMPPNCKEFYEGIGVCVPDQSCTLAKNPVNYVIRKNFQLNKTKRKNNNKF
jgi:DNA primase catalytic subunit